MAGKGFKGLNVWQRARDMAVYIYRITGSDAINKDFGLRDQMRRSSVSVASNIAEGAERGSNKEAVRFFYIAKGSLAEVMTQVDIANEIGYLQNSEYEYVSEECELIGGMLGNLIKARNGGLR